MAKEDLYQMFGLEKSASQADIKKAYYKLALQWHPDRNSAPEATTKFQALQRVYDVLSDPVKRQLYDRTGSLQDCEEMVQSDNFQDLYAAFREALKVTEEDIDAFATKYRGSAEERADLLSLYTRHGGNMTRVFDCLMLSRPDLDRHRFMDTIEEAIAAGEVKRLKAYKPWAAEVAAAPRPTTDPLAPPGPPPAGGKKRGKKQGSSADDDLALVAAIKNKQPAFNGMLAALEAKYASGGGSGSSKAKKQQKPAAAEGAAGGGGGSSKRKRGSKAAQAAEADSSSDKGDQQAEPTDEEFAAAQARLAQNKKQQSSRAGGMQRSSRPAAAAGGKGKGKKSKDDDGSGSDGEEAAAAKVNVKPKRSRKA